MLQLPPHNFDRFEQNVGQAGQKAGRLVYSSAQKIAMATLWKNKLLLLGMGIWAILLLAERNSKALAEARSAPHNMPPSRRPAEDSEKPLSSLKTVWVNPQTGSDLKADGSEQAPFRSITRALAAAASQTVIQLAAGTYSAESGEQFPIRLQPNVTVQGHPDNLGQAVVIRGSGSYSSQTAGRQNVAIVGANQAVISGVTITNPAVRGYGLWIEAGSPTIQSNTFTGSNTGLIAIGSSSPIVKNNLFMLNRSGLQITGTAQPQVQDNIFQRTGTGITIGETAAGRIMGNRISQNRDGVIVQDQARPALRRNQIEDSERDGLVVLAQAQPDLGSHRDPGQNQFLNSQQHDVNATTSQTLSAVGNQITGQTVGKLDLTGQLAVAPSAPASLSTPANLIASLPPALAANKTSVSTTRPAAPPTYQTIAFAPASLPINIAVPPPERVGAAARLQPAGLGLSNRPAHQSHQPFSAASLAPVSLATVSPVSSAPTAPASTSSSVMNQVVVTAAASLPRQNFSALNAPTLGGSPINVPAPPAERRASSQPVRQTSSPLTSSSARQPAPNSSLLPVPAGDIPVGNIGDMTRVSLAQVNSRARASQLGTSAQSSQYRVLVATTDDQVQSQVQALVPDAFSTSIQGQSALQIGAFSSYANAQEAVQLLSQNGLQGIIQPIE